jgi:hypothetical protein
MVYKKLPTIKTEPYNYSIEGQKDEYYLYVQCNNSAGMYEIRKKLTDLMEHMRENPDCYIFSY